MAPHGEPQGEAAPRARLALDRDAAVMGLRHVLHQREAHASAPPPLSLAPPHPVEFLEDLPLLLRGDPIPSSATQVGDSPVEDPPVPADRTRWGRVLNR